MNISENKQTVESATTIAPQAQTALQGKKRKPKNMVNGLKTGCGLFAFLLLFPALFNFVVFWIYPNFDSIVMSFQGQFGEFTFGNYQWVLGQVFGGSGSGIIGEALRNTLIYFTVGYFVIQTWNIIVAYFFYKKIAMYKVFRFILNLPGMLAGLIMVTLYKNIIGPEGPIITWLYNAGVIGEKYMLLFDTRFAMGASVGYSLWLSVGSVYLWTSGALARVPTELLEAAQLDGITPFGELVHIILPMISGTLSTLYIIGAAGVLGSGGATMYLTFGEYGTMTLSFWIIKQVYTGAGTGTTTALGILMTLVSLPLVYLMKWISGKVVPDVSY